MKTTLNEIRAHKPCASGWTKLLAYLGKTKPDDEPLDLMIILKSNGIEDATWVLRVFDYKDYCLFNADVAESVLHIFEDKYPEDNRPRKAIEAIRQYKAGQITKDVLKDAAAYSYSAYSAYSAANAAAVAADSYSAVNVVAAAAATRQAKWEEIKQLFIKHFGDK